MNPSFDEALIARAIAFSLNAAQWELDAKIANNADERFSRRIRAEICRRSATAALRDVGSRTPPG